MGVGRIGGMNGRRRLVFDKQSQSATGNDMASCWRSTRSVIRSGEHSPRVEVVRVENVRIAPFKMMSFPDLALMGSASVRHDTFIVRPKMLLCQWWRACTLESSALALARQFTACPRRAGHVGSAGRSRPAVFNFFKGKLCCWSAPLPETLSRLVCFSRTLAP